MDLHHFYCAMAWLGKEIEEKNEEALAPRCVKDVIEEKMFDKRRDLFADLSADIMPRDLRLLAICAAMAHRQRS